MATEVIMSASIVYGYTILSQSFYTVTASALHSITPVKQMNIWAVISVSNNQSCGIEFTQVENVAPRNNHALVTKL